MSTVIPDLWPTDFGQSVQPSPSAILRQQGYLLGQRTKNFVIGEVQSSGTSQGFWHEFFISAPLLNFRQPLLLVEHGMDLYPAKLKARNVKNPNKTDRPITAKSANDFLSTLAAILTRAEVTELIRSLLDQCEDLEM
jgi:hypothetical protein